MPFLSSNQRCKSTEGKLDQTCEKKFTGSIRPHAAAMANISVTRMLTRDLFAVADLVQVDIGFVVKPKYSNSNSKYLGCTSEVFHVNSYQDQFI